MNVLTVAPLCLVFVLGAACEDARPPTTCLSASSLSLGGTLTLTTSSAADGGGASSDVATVSVSADNFSPFGECPTDEDYLLEVGACQLHAISRSSSFDLGDHASGDFISETSSIVADAQLSCSVPSSAGPLTVMAQDGTLVFTPTTFTLDVTATAPDGSLVTFHVTGPDS